jgi:thioredoxin-related protein
MRSALALVVFLASSVGFSQELFDPKRDPAKDLVAAVKQAGKQNKRILIDVGGNWCGWCKKLDAFFKADAEAAQILKKSFVVVKVNFSQENQNKPFLSKYPTIEGYPHLFVLDKKGKLIHSQNTSDLETGDHHDPAKVNAFLRKFAS